VKEDYRNDNDNKNNNNNYINGATLLLRIGGSMSIKSSKRTNFISNEVKYVVIAVVVIAIIWLGLRFFLQVNSPFYVVSSESMVPTLQVGDLVVLKNGPSGFSFNDLQAGDIIVFHTEDGGGRTIVHRIAEIYHGDNATKEGAQADERLVKTKGDNNPVSYEGLDYPIRETDYDGKVILIIPKVGLVTIPPYNYIIAGIAVGLVSVSGILSYISFQKKESKNNNNSSKARQ